MREDNIITSHVITIWWTSQHLCDFGEINLSKGILNKRGRVVLPQPLRVLSVAGLLYSESVAI